MFVGDRRFMLRLRDVIVPPQPAEMPLVYLGGKHHNKPRKANEFGSLPDGCELVPVGDDSFVLPMDRQGVLRKPKEAWWETTVVDGQRQWVVGCFDGKRAFYYRPKGFYERKLCSARFPKLYKWCDYPAGKCAHGHCGRWNYSQGRACDKPCVHGTNRCGKHTRKPTGIKPIKAGQSHYDALIQSGMKPAMAAIHKKIVELGTIVNLHSELSLVRAQLVDAIGRASKNGETDSWVADLKRTVNAAVKFHNEGDEASFRPKFAELARLIQVGSSASDISKHIRSITRDINSLIKTQSQIDVFHQQSMNADQAMVFVGYFVSLVTKVWGHDVRGMLEFKAGMDRGLIPSGQIIDAEIIE